MEAMIYFYKSIASKLGYGGQSKIEYELKSR